MSPRTARARPRERTQAPAPTVSSTARADAPRPLPTLGQILSPREPFLIPLLLLIVARVAMWVATPLPAEDAFITFRYARNLAAGHGLVYNPGEHVMGFTSPLWTLWCALGVLAMRDPVPWARASGIAADAVTLLTGGTLLLTYASRASAWCFTFFLAAWLYFAATAVSGLEMSACAMLVVLSGALVAARSRAAGPSLGALALTRPEGVLAAAILGVGARWRDRWIAAGIVIAAAIALTVLYGNPIPNSVAVKAQVYGTPGPLAGRIWWEWLSPAIMGRWPASSDGVLLAMLVVIAAPAFVVGIVRLWTQGLTPLGLVAASLVAVWLGYALLGVTYFWWYLTLPLLGMTLVASVGLPSIVRGRAVPATLAIFVLTVWTLSFNLYVGRAGTETKRFGAMADAVREHAAPGDTVMLEPIGMIGYIAPIVVIDETGLVTPGVARRRLQGPGWYTDIVQSRNPKWLVVRLSAFHGKTGFAGAGTPFRTEAERDSTFARYHMVGLSGVETDPSTLALLVRFR